MLCYRDDAFGFPDQEAMHEHAVCSNNSLS